MGKVKKIERDTCQDKIVVNRDGTMYPATYLYDIIENVNLKEDIKPF